MFNIIKETKNPKVLVVTPLLPGHKISKETKKTLKRNTIPFTWISSEGNNNIPTNLENGLDWYDNKFGLPDYYMMVDRDIIAGRNLIDRLYSKLFTIIDKSEKILIAFSYASFEFKGYINYKFPAIPYDASRLIQANYISSNSMFHTWTARKVGIVKNDKYKRLLDWAFLLKLLSHGYIGINCPEASFVAMSSKSDISAGTSEDYRIKSRRVIEDFVKPMLK